MKKTWIIPHKAAESFGWMLLDGFDGLKLYLNRLPAKAAKVSHSNFWRKLVYCGTSLQLKTFKGS